MSAAHIRDALTATLSALRELGTAGSRYRRSTIREFQTKWNFATDSVRAALLERAGGRMVSSVRTLIVDGIYGPNTKTQMTICLYFSPVTRVVIPQLPPRAAEFPTWWRTAESGIQAVEQALAGSVSPAPPPSGGGATESAATAVAESNAVVEPLQRAAYSSSSATSESARTGEVIAIEEPLVVTARAGKAKQEVWPWVAAGVGVLALVVVAYGMVK